MSDDARELLFAALGWGSPPARALEALTHPSFANERRQGKRPARGPTSDNQVLEFLGDAVLGLCASELLIEAFPQANEGELSKRRSLMVSTQSLAAFARSVGVGPALQLGKGAQLGNEANQDSVLADAVEALVAAAYLDGGHQRARALVEQIFAFATRQPEQAPAEGKPASSAPLLDAKSELNERVQASGQQAPSYHLVGTSGPENERIFEVEARVADRVLGAGRGRSKKLAEQDAARDALTRLSAPDRP